MEIFKLFGSIFIDNEKANESISKTDEKGRGLAGTLGNGIKVAAKWGVALAAGAAAVGGSMMAAAGKVAAVTDEIDKASRRAGTSAENWQKLNYAFGQSGIESSKLEQTMIRNQRSMNDAAKGGAKASAAYNTLGVSIKNADGTLRDADAVYQDTLKSLADLEDKNLRNAVANDIFGKSYGDLAPILDEGSEGIDALTSRAEQLGLVLSQETVDAGVVFGDTLDDIGQVGGALFNMIAAEMLPVLQKFLDFIIDSAPTIQDIVRDVVGFVQNAVSAFTRFWDENGKAISDIASAIFEILKEIIQIGMDVLKSIVGVVMGIIQGDWEKAWNSLLKVIDSIFGLIKLALEAAMSALVAIIKGAGSLLFDIGKSAFLQLWDGMKSVWESIQGWVSDKVSWLVDKLAFWRKSEEEMDDDDVPKPKPKPRGSHAGGLAYVPYDGYNAELHRGEKVLTAEQAKEHDENRQKNGRGGETYVFNSPKALTPAEARRQMKKARKELLFDF